MYTMSITTAHTILSHVNTCSVNSLWSCPIGHAHQDTLLHFAARYNLPHLFSLLLTLPGGREAVQVCNEGLKYPVDLAKESGSHEITRILEGSVSGRG